MAYETGTATGVIDLVNKFATFIEANGWTRDTLADDGSGRRYHAHRGLQYLNMRGYVNEAPGANFDSATSSGVYSVAFNIGTAYSGATTWYNQTGVPIGTSTTYGCAGMTLTSGAITAYHFFAHNSGDQVYAVIERASGFYTYLGFGLLTKYGSFTGGDIFFGGQSGVTASTDGGFAFLGWTSYSSGQSKGYVKVDVDSQAGWHWGAGESYQGRDTTLRYVRDDTHGSLYTIGQQPNTHNGLSVVRPVKVRVEREATHLSTTALSPIGEIPNIGTFVIADSIVPGQQVTYGSENYRVFPYFAKDTNVGYTQRQTTHSGREGWAIKE